MSLAPAGYKQREKSQPAMHTVKEVVMESADHAMGLELQLVELVEQQTRAVVQHRDDDAARLEPEIVQLRGELAAIGEVAFP